RKTVGNFSDSRQIGAMQDGFEPDKRVVPQRRPEPLGQPVARGQFAREKVESAQIGLGRLHDGPQSARAQIGARLLKFATRRLEGHLVLAVALGRFLLPPDLPGRLLLGFSSLWRKSASGLSPRPNASAAARTTGSGPSGPQPMRTKSFQSRRSFGSFMSPWARRSSAQTRSPGRAESPTSRRCRYSSGF